MLNAGCLSFAAATWEGSRPEEADGLSRKDVARNEEQRAAEGQWDWQHRLWSCNLVGGMNDVIKGG